MAMNQSDCLILCKCIIRRNISRPVNGENVLGGVAYKNKYIKLITRVSVRYGEIFHKPKASEISCHISQLTSVISALFL